MKRIVVLLCMVFTLFSFKTIDHESYLSVTEIEYREDLHDVQIISRVFLNDFEDVLTKRYAQEISLSNEGDLKKNKDVLEKYLQNKLFIEVDNKKLDLHFLGSKYDADQLVLFIEVKDVNSFKKVKVENLILTDLFDAQKNIVHVKRGKKIESMLLMKETGAQLASF
ncbi:DUF6702 family protein [Gramella sp. AN32]|uniref:DUF6702 family protein n=1 Tax=Christiangramia antarctica TaxID=2058158 RepID=A0ABW5X6R4_9FLAO|nr:DUF6702 family protein [Gramella sp. AN32]MCM4155885.1 hypothetical protein [Gramella sp. AN32]